MKLTFMQNYNSIRMGYIYVYKYIHHTCVVLLTPDGTNSYKLGHIMHGIPITLPCLRSGQTSAYQDPCWPNARKYNQIVDQMDVIRMIQQAHRKNNGSWTRLEVTSIKKKCSICNGQFHWFPFQVLGLGSLTQHLHGLFPPWNDPGEATVTSKAWAWDPTKALCDLLKGRTCNKIRGHQQNRLIDNKY